MVTLVIWFDGDKHWVVNDLFHRDTGPAVVYNDGTKMWYCRGRRHRADGPAIEHEDGTLYWYWRSRNITEYEHMMLVEQEQVHD